MILPAPAAEPISYDFPEKMQFLFQPAKYKVAYGGRMGLKCLGKGTRVLLFSGELRKVEDIVIGDVLMGPDSQPRTVTSVGHGVGPLYKVSQVCGISYVVNDAHILSLKRVHATYFRKERGNKFHTRYRAEGAFVNISIEEYLKKSPKWKAHFVGHKSTCVHFEQVWNGQLPIHPYFLGLWLGDGTSRELRLTAHIDDLETINWCGEYTFSAFGLRMSLCRSSERRAYDIGFIQDKRKGNLLLQEFRALGLLNDKHIPFSYQVASEKERLELLAGLIDSDGSKVRNGGYNFVNTNKELARSTKRLADFLGFKTSVRSHQPTMPNAVRAYTVHISGDVWRIPCKLPRKITQKESKKDDFLATGIRVEPLGEGEYFGFTLDGDHLFLLEDGTVTHNSWSFARALLILGLTGRERILCAREMQKSIEESVHKLLADQISLMQMNYLYDVQQAHIIGRGSASGTSFSFEGLWRNINKVKSYEGITHCWVEEAAKLSKVSWGVLEPTVVRNAGAEIWLSFNPELDEDFVYQYFIVHEPPPGSIVVKTSYRDNQWLPQDAIDSIVHLRETDYDEYLHVYEGNTRQVLEGAIFASELRAAVEEERIRHVPYDRSVPVDVVFDLGRNDFTAMWFFQRVGFEYHLIDFFQDRLKHIDHYLRTMQELGYLYGLIFLPHDAKAKMLGSKLTIQEQISAKYPNQTRIVAKHNLQDQINAARTIFPRCFFDAKRTQEGIRVLRKWCYKIDPVTRRFSQTPEHDGFDAAAAFCYFALATGMRVRAAECKLDLPNAVRERGIVHGVTDIFNQTTERLLGDQRASTRWLGR